MQNSFNKEVVLKMINDKKYDECVSYVLKLKESDGNHDLDVMKGFADEGDFESLKKYLEFIGNNCYVSNFGKVKGPFNQNTLKFFVEQKNIEGCKKYVSSYFIISSETNHVFKWNPESEESKISVIEDKVVRSRYLMKSLQISSVSDDKKEKWVLQDWFFGPTNTHYTPIFSYGKPLIYKGPNGGNYINLMPHNLHSMKDLKKFREYPVEVQKKVEIIWNHVKDSFCSGDLEQYFYCRNWFSKIVSGIKMESCIYMRSMEGIGKGIFYSFLQEKVLGPELVCQSSDMNIITGRFNGMLAGKLLFIMEEVPCASTSDYKNLTSKLKNLITEKRITIEKKGKDHFYTKNICSFAINTNENAITMPTAQRRMVQLDTSSIHKGDRSYFDTLGEIMKEDIVGEAFFVNCLEFSKANPYFDAQFNKPNTKAQAENIATNAHSYYTMIKEKFVLKGLGLDIKAKELYENYQYYCQKNNIKYVQHKNEFFRKLEEIGIFMTRGDTKHQNQNWYTVSKEALFNVLNEQNMISINDEFSEGVEHPEIKIKKSKEKKGITFEKIESLVENSVGKDEFLEYADKIIREQKELEEKYPNFIDRPDIKRQLETVFGNTKPKKEKVSNKNNIEKLSIQLIEAFGDN